MTTIMLTEILPHAKDLPPPDYETVNASGLDLRAAISEPIALHAGARILVQTGLRVAIPEGFEGQIRPRSGLAYRYGITVINSPGTIDQDYRGELGVLLVNHSKEDFLIERGMRIAQLVIAPVERVKISCVEQLPSTVRGKGGFGHTGLK